MCVWGNETFWGSLSRSQLPNVYDLLVSSLSLSHGVVLLLLDLGSPAGQAGSVVVGYPSGTPQGERNLLSPRNVRKACSGGFGFCLPLWFCQACPLPRQAFPRPHNGAEELAAPGVPPAPPLPSCSRESLETGPSELKDSEPVAPIDFSLI